MPTSRPLHSTIIRYYPRSRKPAIVKTNQDRPNLLLEVDSIFIYHFLRSQIASKTPPTLLCIICNLYNRLFVFAFPYCLNLKLLHEKLFEIT